MLYTWLLKPISNMTLGRLDEESTVNIGRIEGGS